MIHSPGLTQKLAPKEKFLFKYTVYVVAFQLLLFLLLFLTWPLSKRNFCIKHTHSGQSHREKETRMFIQVRIFVSLLFVGRGSFFLSRWSVSSDVCVICVYMVKKNSLHSRYIQIGFRLAYYLGAWTPDPDLISTSYSRLLKKITSHTSHIVGCFHVVTFVVILRASPIFLLWFQRTVFSTYTDVSLA